MRLVLTGAAGFLGRYVAAEAEQRSWHVASVDARDGLDVRSTATREMIADGWCDAVIHLAGVLGTAELFDRPETAVEVNVLGALNVLEGCKARRTPYVEITMPDCWPNLYQATKMAAKRIASAYHHHYGVPTTHVRAFNAYGTGQKVHGVQKIVPTFATRAWRGQPVPVWGDGDQQVDLVHAADIAKVLCDAVEVGGDDCVLDAGTGKGVTVNEVAHYVLERTGSAAGVQYLPMRAGETPGTIAVAEGDGWARLGWKPDLDWDRLGEVVDWYQEDRP